MLTAAGNWLKRRFGIVRVRKVFDQLRHSLSFIPGMYVLAAIVLVQITLFIDRKVDDGWLPEALTTTVGSARAVLGAMAGGLITSITLLLSMMLITIQLASAQFSPRTLRDWLGDRLLQHTVGLALGTTVFSLLALRSARTFGEGENAVAVTPHFSVLLALALGVLALFGVVRSVDHVTHSVRIGSVSRRIANETIEVARAGGELRAGQRPAAVPATTLDGTESEQPGIPESASPIITRYAGWVQQIDEASIIEALPDGATAYVTAPLGGFIPAEAPLMWVDPPLSDDDDETHDLLADGFATGDSRTMQQDVAFGLLQLTDIAVRALSPGVNDPSTANDVVVQIGNVMLALWAQPQAPNTRSENGRTIVRHQAGHGEHLNRAFEPIRRYGIADPHVLRGLVRVLLMIRSEATRRDLPGPVEPINDLIDAIDKTADRTVWSASESDDFDALMSQR